MGYLLGFLYQRAVWYVKYIIRKIVLDGVAVI